MLERVGRKRAIRKKERGGRNVRILRSSLR